MAMKDVWGFDPNEAARAQALFRGATETDTSGYSINQEFEARIPHDESSQIVELRILFRR